MFVGTLFFIYLLAFKERKKECSVLWVWKWGGFGTGDKHDQICCMKKILNEKKKRIMEMIKRKKTSS